MRVEISRLPGLKARGLSDTAIARVLGCSRRTICNYRRALGILPSKWRMDKASPQRARRGTEKDRKEQTMPKINQYKCDGCGAEKGATNHWWVVNADECGFVVIPLDLYEAADRIAPGKLGGEIFFACGEACVIKKVSQLMGEMQRADAAEGKAVPA
jgi:hypothetical protein